MTPSRKRVGSRERVLVAARKLVLTKSFQGTTTAEIAKAAGVSVQTVYFLFRNRTGLLQALWEDAVFGEEHRPPPQQEWYLAAQTEPDLQRALGRVVSGGVQIASRLAPIAAALEALPPSPALDEFRSRDMALRQDGLRRTVEMLAAKGGLRQGMTVGEASDIMLTLLSPDSFRYLVLGRGWTVDRFRSWVVETLSSTVFVTSRPRSREDAAAASRVPVRPRRR